VPDDRGGGGVRIISKPATGLLGDADPRDIAGQVKPSACRYREHAPLVPGYGTRVSD